MIHPGYRIFWLVWLGAQLVALLFGWWGILLSRALWVYFGIVEGLAVRRVGKGDTLSEFMQSIAAMGPNSHWWQGWPALVTTLTVLLSMHAAWTAGYGVDDPLWRAGVGIVVGVGVFWWLLFHWLNARVHK